MLLRYDAEAIAANEAAATPLHNGGRQTGRQVIKYAAKTVAKKCAKFGDILDLISANWTILKNVSFGATDWM